MGLAQLAIEPLEDVDIPLPEHEPLARRTVNEPGPVSKGARLEDGRLRGSAPRHY